MKKIYFSIISVFVSASAITAQNPCFNGRYANDVFTTLTTTSGIAYGSNTKYNGASQTLTLDFYQPAADTSTARPLIIWAHGGSFVGGSSTDADVVSLSQHFAKKGFVCASINYRLGFFPFDSANAVPAVIRAVQDMKAAIRFFYKDRATTNTYKIDTNNIFIGGSSAGAIAALHVQYLDRDCEILPYVSQTKLNTLGGLTGASGNAGYSQKVKGVINLCGALAVYAWLEPGNLPFVSMHGTIDGTVKYTRGIVNPGTPLMYLDGSRFVNKQAVTIGVSNPFYTWLGADHVPYVQGGTAATQLAYMDTTVNFVRDYLISRLACSDPALQNPNAPYGVATLYPFTVCAVGIESVGANLIQQVYPNPSDGSIKIVFVNGNTSYTVQLTDVAGRVVKTISTEQSVVVMEKGDLTAGIYFLKVVNSSGQSSIHKIMFY